MVVATGGGISKIVRCPGLSWLMMTDALGSISSYLVTETHSWSYCVYRYYRTVGRYLVVLGAWLGLIGYQTKEGIYWWCVSDWRVERNVPSGEVIENP